MKFNPLNKTVLVKLEASPEATPGGIILPDNARDKQGRGRVVAVTGITIPLGVTVLFPAYVGSDYEQDGVSYKIVKSEDLLGYLDD